MPRHPTILFVHDNFPAQFGGLGRWLAARGWKVVFATAATGARDPVMTILPYSRHRDPMAQTHPYALPMERAAIAAQGFARAALAARKEGLSPDVVVAHSGWGAGMFAKDVFPTAAFVAYCEWWYRYPGADVAFLAEMERRPLGGSPEAPILERARNAPIAMDLSSADAAICPTRFQASQFPQVFLDRLQILHDGIDTRTLRPDAEVARSDLGGLVPEGASVITYATRGMEPHRGFPQFMAALPAVLAANPKAFVVIAGENRVAYGGDGLRKVDWKARALAENAIDPARIRFTGKLSRHDYVRLLQRSDAHVYLTVPFVLSWSMLEVMSVGVPLVASDTAPVREFADDTTARLVDMARPASIADALVATLEDRGGMRRLAARKRIVETIDQETEFARKARLFAELGRLTSRQQARIAAAERESRRA